MSNSELNLWKNTFYLDPTSPTGLRWKVFNNAIKEECKRYQGDVAGFKKRTKDGSFSYYRVKLKGKNYAVHRIVWSLYNDNAIPEKHVINHIDCNTFNNSIDNLEICAQIENTRRRKEHVGVGLSIANTSGYTGISLDRKEDKLRGKISYYYAAFYNDEGGKTHKKHFSINKYGEIEALRLAREWREDNMNKLKLLNIGYK